MSSPSSVPSRFPRSAAYSRYAEVYDEIGQRVFGERIAEATLHFLGQLDVHPRSVIDLACGTGAASLIFAAAGMRVLGIDLSAAMLAQARRSAEQSGLPVAWRQDDMRSFTVDEPVDLATCFYDGINYLTELDEVRDVFGCVRASLVPGGLFIFDLNTIAKFNSHWNESCFVAVDRDDLYGVYQSWFQPDSGISPLILTFFVRTDTGTWERFDEEHVERAYALDEIDRMLAEAGLKTRAIFDYPDRFPRFGAPGSERSHRVVFVAERLGQTTVMES